MNMVNFRCSMLSCYSKIVADGGISTILCCITFLGPSRNEAPGRNFEFQVTTKKHLFSSAPRGVILINSGTLSPNRSPGASIWKIQLHNAVSSTNNTCILRRFFIFKLISHAKKWKIYMIFANSIRECGIYT